jgi:M6 family metalloprotease-like protein
MHKFRYLSLKLPSLVLATWCVWGSSLEAVAATDSKTRTKSGPVPNELKLDHKRERITAQNFLPKRKTPVFKGAFSVGIVLIKFPDTRLPDLEEVKAKLFSFDGMTVTDYFKEYSQNTSWPELMIVGEADFPKCVYLAPQPKGYYCEHDFWNNPLGYPDGGEGNARATQLRAAAEKYAFSFYKKPGAGGAFPLQSNGRPHVVCYAFATDVVAPSDFRDLIRPHYKGLMKSYDKTAEAWDLYKPIIGWSDPLWPNSIPQVEVSGGGGTFCHELGHVMGAPDYYHAPEKFDGIPGAPCLEWAYGPTGPGYCRYIYNGFLTAKNYPTWDKSGTYTLYPRKTNPAEEKPLGCFVPSSHPNYLYYLEYVQGEKAPLGNPGKKGLLIHVINVTLNSPLLGAPDICYTYRPNDPWFRSGGNSEAALWGEATGRKSFSTNSEPASRLPNLLDGGVTVDDIVESSDSVSFKMTVKTVPVTGTALKTSFVPKISLDEISEVMPTSIRASGTVLFRGEPMKTDYGFCLNTQPRPALGNQVFPLYHRDRYGGRILGLKPNTKYYVRAYARNEEGVSYSKEELIVKTPLSAPLTNSVPPLLEDGFSGNWTIERYYGSSAKDGVFIGSSSVTTLLKLTAYYRESLTSGGTRSNNSSAQKKGKEPLDYTRIHLKPSLNVPTFRMKDFNEALSDCSRLADSAMMRSNVFSKVFDKEFAKTFGMKISTTSKIKPILQLDKKSVLTVAPLIKESLAASKPVVVAQESILLTPREHALSWVIIDGYNEDGQFHLVYPRGQDRDFERKTGWYPLETLLIDVNDAKIIFGINPQG